MTYRVPLYNQYVNGLSPAIQVDDGAISYSDTTIGLVGNNYANYSQGIAEGLVWQLENFAGPNSPDNPLIGQLWFESTNGSMKFYNGVQWIPLATTTDAWEEFPSSLIPDEDDLYDLGSVTHRWRTLYATSININGASLNIVGDLLSDGTTLLDNGYDIDSAPSLGLVSKGWVNSKLNDLATTYVAIAGGSMLGELYIADDTNGLTVSDERAVPASYIESHYINKSGGTMEGTLTLQDGNTAASTNFVQDRTDWTVDNTTITSTTSFVPVNLTRYRYTGINDITITVSASTADYFQVISTTTATVTIIAGIGVTLTGLGNNSTGTVASFLYTGILNEWDVVGDIS